MQVRLQKIVPEAKIRYAHGQLPERELESIMRDFYHQRFNVLLCTTIIESGIDIPTANTIIINKAERFGLAQLHQLRGRVGRSHHQAYAYMLTPPLQALGEDAQKRLTAIESLNTLGVGFALASQDLEIRGAGEILGESQSGAIDGIGYSLYSSFLDQAITSLKRARQTSGDAPTAPTEAVDINLHIAARFPDDYLPDVHQRLTIYKRISNAQTEEQLDDLKVEAIDRFGILPDAANNLFAIAQLKLRTSINNIISIQIGPNGGRFKFSQNADIDIEELMRLIASKPQQYSMRDAQTLQIIQQMDDVQERFQCVNQILALLH